MSARLLWCTLVLGAAGCGSVTDQGPVSVNLVGSWHYVAAQTTGNRVTYDGTLTITQQQGRAFAGGLDAQAVVPQGNILRVNGVVSGRIPSSSSVDFDLQFPDDTRRHVGSVVGDTIKGSWASADLSLLGGFTAVRH